MSLEAFWQNWLCLKSAKKSRPAPMNHLPDSRYSWTRLAASIALATTGGIGLWAGVVVLPFIQADFHVDRAGASFPYTMTMLGFAFGGISWARIVQIGKAHV